MKVSVCIRTFNHEAFISQTVESVLNQQTDFDIEILIGDDASTDKTRVLLEQLGQQHPQKIRLFLNETNIGSRQNLLRLYSACNGKYIAILDGDDYWLRTAKVQKQADFLDRHENVTVCGTCWQSDNQTRLPPPKPIANLRDFISGGNQLTCGYELLQSTLMIRKSALPVIPAWIDQIKLADLTLQFLCLQKGDMACLEEISTFYRQHENAGFSQLSGEQRIHWDVVTWEEIRKHIDPQYHRQIDRRLAGAYYRLSECYRLMNKREQSRSALAKANAIGSSADRLRHVIRSHMPRLYKLALSLKARLA